MSDQDNRPAISPINLPYRLRRDGWWLEDFPATRRDVIRAAPQLVLIKGRDKEEDNCKKWAR
jgi:hypothetical protein